MNIRLYLGAVTFPLQVKLWVHTVQMLAKTRVVTNGQINSDYLIESEIDLTGEKSRARSCVWTQWIKCMTFSFYVQQFLRLVRAIG